MEPERLLPPSRRMTGGDTKGAVERMTSMAAADEVTSMGNQLFPVDDTLMMKSDFPPGMILSITRAKLIQRMSKSAVINEYLNILSSVLISKDRKGRDELIEAMSIYKNANKEEGL